jgi:hypothetical protein
MAGKHEKRHFSRVAYQGPAVLELSSRTFVCEVLDISLKGALVALPPDVTPTTNEPCVLEVQLDGHSAIIRMVGHITHQELEHAGLRCDEIDLESVQHLRRLLELNLADERLLHRELHALVDPRRK